MMGGVKIREEKRQKAKMDDGKMRENYERGVEERMGECQRDRSKYDHLQRDLDDETRCLIKLELPAPLCVTAFPPPA